MNTTKTALRTIARTTDEALFPLTGKINFQRSTIDGGEAALARAVAAGNAARVARIEADLVEDRAKLEALEAEAAPLKAIAAAGKWTRFIFVPGGHVHRFGYCPTLRMTTAYFVLPDYSGADEAELVEDAADAACTVCFPSAPVDRRSKVAAVVKEREEREAEAAEKAAKRQKAASAAILDESGKVAYKTQRAAENALGEALGTMAYFSAYYPVVGGYGIPEAPNTETREAHAARMADLVDRERRTARSIVELLKANVEGYDADAVVAKKLAAKTKELAKNGAELPADLGL